MGLMRAAYREQHPAMLDAKAKGPEELKGMKAALIAEVGEKLWMLFGAVGVVLLIVCANVASLMLARATARGHEIAIRLSVGAARSQLVRQLLIESGLLGLAGAVLGVALAWGGSRVLLAMERCTQGRNPRP